MIGVDNIEPKIPPLEIEKVPPDKSSSVNLPSRALTPNSAICIHSNVVKHEAGHAVGLDHVSDPQEIMDPYRIWQNSDWGPGTSIGLAELGKC